MFLTAWSEREVVSFSAMGLSKLRVGVGGGGTGQVSRRPFVTQMPHGCPDMLVEPLWVCGPWREVLSDGLLTRPLFVPWKVLCGAECSAPWGTQDQDGLWH